MMGLFSVAILYAQKESIEMIVLNELSKLEVNKSGKPYVFKLSDLENVVSSLVFDDNGKFVVTEVVPVEGKTKDELYESSLKYIVKTFRSAQRVIDLQDKEGGVIVCKGIVTGKFYAKDALMTYVGEEPLYFTMSLEFKDNRYKIQITDLYTEKGDLMDEGMAFECFLDLSFYDKNANRGALRYRTQGHYQNLRTQLILTQLLELFDLKNGLQQSLTDDDLDDDW